jgi:hypothetical protein
VAIGTGDDSVLSMGRALTAVGVALVLIMGGLALAVFVSRDEDNIGVDNILAEELTRAFSTWERVDLADPRLPEFEWDRVLVVARGTPREAISERLGDDWTGLVGFDTGELFIFMNGDEVARFADFRGSARFEGLKEPITELPRNRAVFDVRDLVITPA